jgi:F0F1-type ATP synthase delta subunit
LSAVALGVLGVAMVVGVVVYFKKGGSVSGLVEKVKANKDLITKAASMLPLTEEQKAKVNAAVNDPTSLLPEQAQKAIDVVKHAKEYEAKAISSLPISDEQKAQLTSVVTSVHDKVVKKAEATPTGVQVKKIQLNILQKEFYKLI